MYARARVCVFTRAQSWIRHNQIFSSEVSDRYPLSASLNQKSSSRVVFCFIFKERAHNSLSLIGVIGRHLFSQWCGIRPIGRSLFTGNKLASVSPAPLRSSTESFERTASDQEWPGEGMQMDS